jgi:hypothetical protein
LESLSTLPRWEGKGFGTAVTAARVSETVAGGAKLVFAQIEAGEVASSKLHECVGFTRVGARQVVCSLNLSIRTCYVLAESCEPSGLLDSISFCSAQPRFATDCHRGCNHGAP